MYTPFDNSLVNHGMNEYRYANCCTRTTQPCYVCCRYDKTFDNAQAQCERVCFCAFARMLERVHFVPINSYLPARCEYAVKQQCILSK